MKKQILNYRELEVIRNTEFLRVKRNALEKIDRLLLSAKDVIKPVWEQHTLPLSVLPVIRPPKISRGENYRGLPWRMLDYPAVFRNHHIFAFRSMFWWGHNFSVTLHLQGEFYEKFKWLPQAALKQNNAGGLFVSCGTSPWEYHYGPDNFIPLSPAALPGPGGSGFLKLSRKISLARWADFPQASADFVAEMLRYLDSAKPW